MYKKIKQEQNGKQIVNSSRCRRPSTVGKRSVKIPPLSQDTVQFTFAIAVSSYLNAETNENGQKPPENISAALAVASNPMVSNGKEVWLGGLD